MNLLVQIGPDKSPKTAILVASKAEILVVKLGHQVFNYDAGTFNGTIEVKDINFLKMSPEAIEEGMAVIEKGLTGNALEAIRLRKSLENEIPLLLEANKVTEIILNGRIDKLLETQLLSKDIHKKAELDHAKHIKVVPLQSQQEHEITTEEVEAIIVREAVIESEVSDNQNNQTIQINQNSQKEVVKNVPSNVKGKGKKSSKKNKNKMKKIDPADLKEEINKSKKAKVEEKPKEQIKTDYKIVKDKGYATVNLATHPTGFFIGHSYPNSKGEVEVIMVGNPKDENKSLPLIFLNKSTASVAYDALRRHPRHSKIIGDQCIVRPITEIDESIREQEAALVVNGLTYVNSLEE